MLLRFVLLLLSISLFAQGPYGNEWIDFDRTYFKFQSKKTGWHSLSYLELQQAGLEMNPNQWKLFADGQQIPIYVEDGMDANNRLSFFGRANDGSFDQQLFRLPEWHAQPDMSLFTDQQSYYLVSDPEGEHLRWEIAENKTDGALPEAETHFNYTSRKIKANAFCQGEPNVSGSIFAFLADFTQGEGWLSGIIKSDLPYNLKIPTPGRMLGVQEKVDVRMKVVGRNRSIGVILDKAMKIEVNGLDRFAHRFSRFKVEDVHFELREDELGVEETILTCKAHDGDVGGWPYETKYSVAWGEIEYARSFDFQGLQNLEFELDIDEDTYFEIENYPFSSAVFLMDMSTDKLFPGNYENGKLKFFIPKDFSLENSIRKFYLFNSLASESIDEMEMKTFTDWSLPENQGNFLVITNNKLRDGDIDQVNRYKEYRSSEIGGEYQVSVVDIEELYDQFAEGINLHPLAIKNFTRLALDNWFDYPPEYLLLLGKSVQYSNTRFSSSAADYCLVPSFGQVPSDVMYASKSYYDYYPELSVGRVSASDSEELRSYLDKLIEYESWWQIGCNPEDRLWMKDVLHISKGWGADQTDLFSGYLYNFEGMMKRPFSGSRVIDLLTDDYDQPFTGQESAFYPAPKFGEHLESGVALINYFGHGIDDYWQYDISENPHDYDWKSRYPIFLSNACSVGMIHGREGEETMVEHYLLADSAGTAGFLASTGLNSVSFINTFTTRLLDHLTITDYGEPFATSVKKTIQDMYSPSSESIRKICTEMLWAGDPALKMYSWDAPEYILNEESFELLDDELEWQREKVRSKMEIQNIGKSMKDSTVLGVEYIDSTGVMIWKGELMIEPVQYFDSLQLELPLPPAEVRQAGLFELRFKIDPDESQEEECYENNIASRMIRLLPCVIGCEEATGLINSESNGPAVYPNPGKGLFTFDSNGQNLHQVLLRSVDGRELKSLYNGPDFQGQKVFDLKSFPAGTYILELNGPSYRNTIQLIIAD